ncbi:ATP-binding cassette domain-containing protein [Streptomyces sp. bgisy027]|uniref:ATP-binding cassette domain-containing protein n=1 Tax=unclassified Streptomyces TaxID=2593676 RepID=UPI003D736702
MRADRRDRRRPPTPPDQSGYAILRPWRRPLLLVSGLTKTYRRDRTQKATALHDVSLDVREGESLGVVGESGSGKTTMARCALGLTTPTMGTIRLGGVDVSNYRGLNRSDQRQVRRLAQVVHAAAAARRRGRNS